MALTDWKVLPHGDIERLSDALWHVAGDLEHIPLGRHMVLAKLPDGRIVVHNAICVSDALMARIEAWGEVAFILVPNAFHRIDAPRWAARFPNAKVLTPDAAKKKVLERVRVDGNYEALPKSEAFEMISLRGAEKSGEGVLRSRDAQGTILVFNDIVMNNVRRSKSLWWHLYTLTGSMGGPRVTGLMKLVGVSDKRALSSHLKELAALPGLHAWVPGHGAIVHERAADILRDVAERV